MNLGYRLVVQASLADQVVGQTIAPAALPALEQGAQFLQMALRQPIPPATAMVGEIIAETLLGDDAQAQYIATANSLDTAPRGFQYRWFIRYAQQLLAREDLSRSEQVLALAQELYPTSHDELIGLGYLRIGQAWLASGDMDAAQRALEAGTAVKAEDTLPDTRAVTQSYLGRIALVANNWDKAREYYEQAVSVDPTNRGRTRWWIWDNQIMLSHLYSRQGDCARAQQALMAAQMAAVEANQELTTRQAWAELPSMCLINHSP